MHPVTSKRFVLLHQTLYDEALEGARELSRGGNSRIISYSRDFERSLPDEYSIIEAATLQKALLNANVVLFGDFHTLRQSQATFAALARSLGTQRKPILALEMFRSCDQEAIDAYLTGSMGEAALRAAVEYEKHWGFPWDNYRLILACARDIGLIVVGLNSHRGGRETMASRDAHAADIIAGTADRHPNSPILALIGEFHLGDNCLPQQLRKRMANLDGQQLVRILTNVDRYYFANQDRARHPRYLQLGEGLYCVMNCAPWIKWQSYTIFEESRFGEAIDLADMAHESAREYDHDYQILDLSRRILNFFGVSDPGVNLTAFRVVRCDEPERERAQGAAKRLRSAAIRRRARYRADVDGFYYSPSDKTALVANFSLDVLAELAAQHALAVVSGFHDDGGDSSEHFCGRVLKYAAGALGAKLLNPNRRFGTRTDFLATVGELRLRRIYGAQKHARTAAVETLSIQGWLDSKCDGWIRGNPYPPKRTARHDVALSFDVSRNVGHMLGSAIYQGMVEGQLARSLVRQLLCSRWKTTEELAERLIELHHLSTPAV